VRVLDRAAARQGNESLFMPLEPEIKVRDNEETAEDG